MEYSFFFFLASHKKSSSESLNIITAIITALIETNDKWQPDIKTDTSIACHTFSDNIKINKTTRIREHTLAPPHTQGHIGNENF